jgi:hypothetical protein
LIIEDSRKFASCIHLYALETPEWAKGFLSLASKKKRKNQRVHPAKNEAGLR